jgi:hypothetical protein
MAKNQGSGEDRAKVKLRITEFELEGSNASVESSIRQITQALNGRNGITQTKVLPGKQPKELAVPEPGVDLEEEEVQTQSEEGADEETAPIAAGKPKRPVKLPVPEYKHDLDLTGTGVSFKDFVASKKIKAQATRYLVAAFWLKDHGNNPTINIHKVYTCYKTAGWPTKLTDWDNIFRQLIRNNFIRRVSSGEYSITPLGENEVRELDGAE